jgi:lipopolysaccharide export system permease protein
VLRLDRYLMQRFLLGIFPALLLLLALFSFMALAEELEDVGKGSFTLPDALLVVFLTTPKRIVELLPVTALLGGLLGLGAMANNRELIAIRSGGLSKRRIAGTVTVLALLLGAGITLLQFFVVPGFEREAAALRGQSLQGTETRSHHLSAFWTRNGGYLIRIGSVQSDRTLAGIEIYANDDRGRLARLVQAKTALHAGQKNWLLTAVTDTRFEGAKVTETGLHSLLWNDLLAEEQAAVLVLPLEALAPNDLLATIANHRRNQLDTHHYEVVFWQQVSLLPGLLAMALLTLPFLLGSVRAVSASQRVMLGGLIGIGFYLLQQLSGHFAGLFGLNPAAIILTPPCILLAAALAAIWRRNL